MHVDLVFPEESLCIVMHGLTELGWGEIFYNEKLCSGGYSVPHNSLNNWRHFMGKIYGHSWIKNTPCFDIFWRNLHFMCMSFVGHQCAGWGWYLSNDFQFYLVTPFVVYLLYKWVQYINRVCEQNSHCAIFHWNYQNYSVKIIYAIIDWVCLGFPKWCIVGFS